MANPDLMDKLVSLCKRRGFVFQSSEIYGGTGSVWDYGPLGAELKRNVKDLWWSSMVHQRDDIEGIDAAILMHPKVWEASGHVEGFSDALVECTNCHRRFRADLPEVEGGQCPTCGTKDTFTEPRMFNLMFKTFMGPVEDSSATIYIRPETAQGSYVNFLNVQGTARQRVPFGIAQIGKAFRNEITPGNFIFRTREFEQAEMEFFVPPGEDQKWFEYWREARYRWYVDLGIDETKLRIRDHEASELAHYAKATSDIEYLYPFGWGELEGIANRADFDLTRHSEASGTDLVFFDPQTKERYTPYVIEPAGGINRMALTLLIDGYEEEQLEKDTRVVLHFHPEIAPITVGVFPLVKKDGMPEKAKEIEAELRRARLATFYDEKGAIGRRYRRQDEVGTPYCVTVDGNTMSEDVVTVRHRDSMEQDKVAIADLRAYLEEASRNWVRPTPKD